MRWIVYFILAYVSLGLQAGLAGPFLRVRGAPPNVVLLAAIFVAINAPRDSALLGCFVLGFMQDLLTTQALGVYALSYSLVGLFIVSVEEYVHRDHPMTHLALGLAGGLITGGVVLAHAWVRGPWMSPLPVMTSAAYTALIGVVVLGVMQRMRTLFAFQPSRRKMKV